MDRLTIAVNADGSLKETDYAQSPYNKRGLAYLHVHNNGLVLLLPEISADGWLREIHTSRKVVIAPPARSGYRKHIDLVFIDGTDSPFSLCLDRTVQVSAPLRNRETILRVYNASGQLQTQMACAITLPMGDTYIAHVTTNTGHSRQAHRSEVADNVLGVMANWLTDMAAGTTRAIYQDKYACRLERESNKSALFIISRVDDTLSHTDIVKFSVCIHTRDKRRAWTEVNGVGNPPPVPFCAVNLLEQNLTTEDMIYLPLLADFEKSMAWAWKEYQDERPKTHPQAQNIDN